MDLRSSASRDNSANSQDGMAGDCPARAGRRRLSFVIWRLFAAPIPAVCGLIGAMPSAGLRSVGALVASIVRYLLTTSANSLSYIRSQA